jgi:hypothetical protein
MKDTGALRSTLCTEDATPRRCRAASRWLIPLMALAIAVSALWPIGLGAQMVHFALSPDVIQVETGDEFEVAVVISDATDLYGIQFDLFFDPVILQVMDIDPERSGLQIALGDFPFPDFVALQEVDNIEGRLSYACTQMRPREPVSGSGTALIVRFQATEAGETELALQGVLAATEDYELDATATSGQVVVAQRAPTATPTADTADTGTGQVPTRTPLPTHTSPASPATATATATAPATASPAMTATSTPAAAYPETPAQQTATPSPPVVPQNEAVSTETAMPTATLQAKAQPSPEGTPAMDEAPAGETEPMAEDTPTPAPTQESTKGAMPTAPHEATVESGVDEPSPTEDAVAARVAPRAPDESAPPPERGERPLVSAEVFVCLSSVLVLFTALLILYVSQRKRGPSRASPR